MYALCVSISLDCIALTRTILFIQLLLEVHRTLLLLLLHCY